MEFSKVNPTDSNNVAVQKSLLKTLPDYYRHYFGVLLNKIDKEQREVILIKLPKPDYIIRGQSYRDPAVRRFIKAVIEKAEEEFEKIN